MPTNTIRPGPRRGFGARLAQRLKASGRPRLSAWGIWTETVVFALGAVLIGRWVSPHDPLFIDSQFPWSWFAPVLVAMRYGVGPGVVGAALLFLGWSVLQPDPLHADIPKLYFLGGLLLTMICGEYSGNWQTRLRRNSEINLYLEDRVERILKRLYLVRLSHDRLEQDLLSRPTTLRDAISDLRRRIAGRTGEGPLPGGADLLGFLAQASQLDVAALYARTADGGYVRVAALGDPPPLDGADPLVAFAEERGQLAHVQVAELDKTLPTPHLVVAPVVNSAREHLGLLVVTRMPFFALNEDALSTLSVLVSAYADGVSMSKLVVPILAEYPGCPIDFAEELVKLTRIQREFGVESRIVMLVFDRHPERLDLFRHVLRNRRGPDVIWNIENLLERSFIITLMPIAGEAAVEGYLLRMQNSLRETFGGDFGTLAIRTMVVSLEDPDPLAAVKWLMSRIPR